MIPSTTIKIERKTHLQLRHTAAEMALTLGHTLDLSDAIDLLIASYRERSSPRPDSSTGPVALVRQDFQESSPNS